MKFIMSEDAHKGVPKADAAVLNAKFIPHSMQAHIQSKFSGTGSKVYLVSGGVTAVKDKIEEVLLVLQKGA